MKANGGKEAQVRDRVKEAAVAMRQVWGIGKRLFRKDWRRRVGPFDRLVWTVMSYGAEIWGWKERKEVEALQERFLRWTMEVD